MLNARRGEWVNGYELQGKKTVWGFSGVDADTRAHELSRIGYFDSPHNRYYIEHRRKGKYAQFRVTLVEPQVSWQESHNSMVKLWNETKQLI